MTSASPPDPLANRARGEIRARFVATAGRTGPARVYQAGGLRLRCPKVQPGLRPDCEAVLINTAGGMVGGDTATLAFEAAAGAAVTVTTQSAEKIYRSTEGARTIIDTTLRLAPGAWLEWLPQETILFDAVDFSRRLAVEMAADASLLIAESLVFGRLARGEAVTTGRVRDQWRVRRGGALVFAEAIVLEGAVRAQLDRAALGAGAVATATLLWVAPRAEAALPAVRAALATAGGEGAASAWNGLLVARLLSRSPAAMRAAMVAVLAALRGRAAPRVWQ